MTSGVSAFGTQYKIGGTAVAEVTSISGPGLSADVIDMTSHDSTTGYREFVQGLKDGGEVSFDIIYVPAGVTHKNASGGLLWYYEQGGTAQHSIVFPDSATTTWTFDAFVTNFEVGAPIDDKLSASVTIKVTGKPTLV